MTVGVLDVDVAAPASITAFSEIVMRLGNVERVDVLPLHKLGAGKYEQLGIPFALAELPA